MGDQITIDTSEITTSPGQIAQKNANTDKSSANLDAKRKKGFLSYVMRLTQAYVAGLVATFYIIPIVTSIIIVILYLVMPANPSWQSVVWGSIGGCPMVGDFSISGSLYFC